MNAPLTLECDVHFLRRGHGARKKLQKGPPLPPPALELGRIPLITRLMALAIRCEQLLRTGEVSHYAELARLAQVTRARVSQIMNLLHLAPDIQEAILFLPRTERGRDPIRLRDLQPIAMTADWRRQRMQWRQLVGKAARDGFVEVPRGDTNSIEAPNGAL